MSPRPVVVDAMGGDHAPDAVVDGALRAAAAGVPVTLVGDEAVLAPLVGERLPVVHAEQVIHMDESPLAAVRAKPRSSIRVGLDEVAAGRGAAFVSCGHSGAILVEGVRALGLLPGVERAGLAVALPRPDGGRLIVLDVGANVDCRAEHLVGFAHLGLAWARTLGIDAPRLGLLSNGEEEGKGNALVRATLERLRHEGVHVAPIEPAPALAGDCDVLVCDGFVGNITLKALEAAVDAVLAAIRGLLPSGIGAEATGRFAPARHGGALLLGVEGLAVVGHGGASAEAVEAAVGLASRTADAGLVEALRGGLGT